MKHQHTQNSQSFCELTHHGIGRSLATKEKDTFSVDDRSEMHTLKDCACLPAKEDSQRLFIIAKESQQQRQSSSPFREVELFANHLGTCSEDEAVSPCFRLDQSQEPSDILETEDLTRNQLRSLERRPMRETNVPKAILSVLPEKNFQSPLKKTTKHKLNFSLNLSKV